MISAPLGQDTPDTFSGSLNHAPSTHHSMEYSFRRPNLNQSDSISSNGGRPPLNPGSEFTSLSRPDPKYADYSLKQKRVESYRNWPPTAKQKPENLIDAGFFYTGQADSVRCFLCGTGLRNWDPEDEPWVEHARWAPECFYVRDKKGQEFINLVQVAVRQQQMQEALQQQTDAMAREATDIAADCIPPNVDTEIQSNAASSQPSTSGRKQPTNAERKNPLLCDAAQSVLAMGYLPRIVKIAVDKVLQSKGWDGMSGSNIANVIFDMEESGEIDKDNCMVPKVVFDSSWKKVNERLPTDMKDLVQKNSEMKERTMCILCCEERVSIVFLPCGHLVSCAQCSPALKNCPVCRESIKGTFLVPVNRPYKSKISQFKYPKTITCDVIPFHHKQILLVLQTVKNTDYTAVFPTMNTGDANLVKPLILLCIILNGLVLVSPESVLNKLGSFISSAESLANSIGGTSGSGQFDRGNGKIVSWSFKGQLMGIKWKYIGICVDQATGTTTTSVRNSRDGSIEHCLRDLFQKLGVRQEL